MLQHCSGRPENSASRLMAIVLELLARMASFEAFWPSAVNTPFLASKSSITASITKSASLTAAARSGLSAMCASAAPAASCVSRPFSTERSTSLWFWARPHEAAANSYRELVAEVRRTILHEVGHHFGMEEDELPY